MPDDPPPLSPDALRARLFGPQDSTVIEVPWADDPNAPPGMQAAFAYARRCPPVVTLDPAPLRLRVFGPRDVAEMQPVETPWADDPDAPPGMQPLFRDVRDRPPRVDLDPAPLRDKLVPPDADEATPELVPWADDPNAPAGMHAVFLDARRRPPRVDLDPAPLRAKLFEPIAASPSELVPWADDPNAPAGLQAAMSDARARPPRVDVDPEALRTKLFGARKPAVPPIAEGAAAPDNVVPLRAAKSEAPAKLAEVVPLPVRPTEGATRAPTGAAPPEGKVVPFYRRPLLWTLVAAAAAGMVVSVALPSGPGNTGNGGTDPPARCPPMAVASSDASVGTPEDRRAFSHAVEGRYAQLTDDRQLEALEGDQKRFPQSPFFERRRALILHLQICERGSEAMRPEVEAFERAAKDPALAATLRQQLDAKR